MGRRSAGKGSVLADGQITGGLSLSGAGLTATNGPALTADQLTVNGSVFLNDGFQASSDSEDGTLRLLSATITGQLSLTAAKIENAGPAGLVVNVTGTTKVRGNLILPVHSFSADQDRSFRLDLDGFSYASVPWDATLSEWLRLLREHTPAYAPQPYQQLAAVHRAAGHDREVRKIPIAQQVDRRRRGEIGGWLRKLLHAAGGLFIGYGHRPWRALGFLAAVCLLAVVVAIVASQLGVAVHPTKAPGEPVTACSTAEAVGMALDTSVPVFKLGGEKRCEIAATTTWGQVFYLAN